MGRQRKNILNQKSKKAKAVSKEELVKEIPIEEQDGSKPKGTPYGPPVTQEDMDLDRFDMTVHSDVHPPVEKPKEDVLEAKIIIGGNELVTKSTKEEEPKIIFTNDPIEIEIPEKPLTRTLTGKEIRRFQRTGIMPK